MNKPGSIKVRINELFHTVETDFNDAEEEKWHKFVLFIHKMRLFQIMCREYKFR